MLRPTVKEVIAGIQRTITDTLAPELTSPFAQGQAMTAAGVLYLASTWLESFPVYDAEEIQDLKQMFDALRPHGDSGLLEAAGYRHALQRGMRACDEDPVDRRAMEGAVSEFAAGVALGRLEGPAAEEVRRYLRRNLERMKKALGAPMIVL